MPKAKDAITKAVDKVLEDKELRALERELGTLDVDSKAIRDVAVQPINALILLLQGDRRTGQTGLDDQRATIRQQIGVAMELKEKEEVRQLKDAYVKVLKREAILLRRLAEHLAETDYIRDNVATWIGIYENFWPRLSSVLKEKFQIDMSGLLAQARDILEEQRAKLRLQQKEQEEDTVAAAASE